MNREQLIFLITVLVGTAALVLVLRPGKRTSRVLGGALAAGTLGALLGQAPWVGPALEGMVFYLLAALTVLSALAAISLVHPLYGAVCFGLSLVGVSGLMAYGGAQFLAAGTLIVYVGAILVVLLFVLMLAHPRGRAPYDWNRWEVFISAGTGMVFLSLLSLLIARHLAYPERLAAQTAVRAEIARGSDSEAAGAMQQEADWSSKKANQGVLAEPHVARIGQYLFGVHWLGVQAAGVLLLAALVGAAVIVGRRRGPLEGPPQPPEQN